LHASTASSARWCVWRREDSACARERSRAHGHSAGAGAAPTIAPTESTIEVFEPTIEPIGPTIDVRKSAIEVLAPTIDLCEPSIEPIERTIEALEPAIEVIEPRRSITASTGSIVDSRTNALDLAETRSKPETFIFDSVTNTLGLMMHIVDLIRSTLDSIRSSLRPAKSVGAKSLARGGRLHPLTEIITHVRENRAFPD
jgi:hypothetical protein